MVQRTQIRFVQARDPGCGRAMVVQEHFAGHRDGKPTYGLCPAAHTATKVRHKRSHDCETNQHGFGVVQIELA